MICLDSVNDKKYMKILKLVNISDKIEDILVIFSLPSFIMSIYLKIYTIMWIWMVLFLFFPALIVIFKVIMKFMVKKS